MDTESLPSGAADTRTISSLLARRGLAGGVDLPSQVGELGERGTMHHAVGREIARGGMGAIYAARDHNCRRTVAMKVILENSAARDEALLRFVEEAQITAQLEHPNIVPVHELGVADDGNVFYTMKMIHGVTLADIIQRLRDGDARAVAAYPLLHLVNIFLKACDAIAFGHSRGVVHRDLKPENIMVGDYGEVLVLDWGLAKIVGRESDVPAQTPADPNQSRPAWVLEDIESARQSEDGSYRTMDGAIMGTPTYMAPEQAYGKVNEIDARTDVYALGAILYTILTLHPPIEAETVHALLLKVAGGAIDNPHTHASDPLSHCPNGQLPSALTAVAMTAMALDPADRYPNVRALQAEIEAWQGGFATAAEHAGLFRQLWLLLRRHRKEAIVGAAALLVIIALVAGFVVRLQAETRRAVAGEQRAIASETETRATLVREQRARYVATIGLADAQITGGVVPPSERLLWNTPQPLRGWEWGYLLRSCHTALLTLPVEGKVDALQFTADNRRLWVAAGNHLKCLDLTSGDLRRLVTGEESSPIYAIAVPRAGDSLLVARDDQSLRLVDAQSGETRQTLAGHEGIVLDLAFSPDEHLLAGSTGAGNVCLWSWPDGHLLYRFPVTADPVFGVKYPVKNKSGLQIKETCFSADGKLLLAMHAHGVIVFDVATREPTVRITHRNNLSAMCLSANGRWVAVGTGVGDVTVADLADGALSREVSAHSGGHILGMTFMPGSDDLLVTAGQDNTVRLTSVYEGRQLACFGSAELPLRAVAVSGDGELLAGGGSDKTLFLWAPNGAAATRFVGRHGAGSYSVRFSPDGSRIACGRDAELEVFDADDLHLLASAKTRDICWDLAWSPDGKRLVTAEFDGLAKVWDADNLRVLATLTGHHAQIWGVAFSPAGDRVATAGNDGTARIWGPDSGRQLAIWHVERGNLDALTWVDGGRRLVVVPNAQPVAILDGESGRVLDRLPQKGSAVAVAPDSHLLAIGDREGAINLYDLQGDQPPRAMTSRHGGWVTALAFSPDGRRLVSGSRDRTVRVWDVETGEQLLAIDTGDQVYSVDFSPDGFSLAVGSHGATVLTAFDWRTTDKAAVEAWQAQRWQKWLADHH